MPIRTHRGRAAVYRKFWGWPVRSPRHLTGTVLAVVVIAASVGLVLPDNHRRSAGHTTPLGSPRISSSTAVPTPALADLGTVRATRPPAANSPAPGTPAPGAALTVARSWVNAFLTVPKGITATRWVEQLRPFTTDELFPELRSIDPANVPAAQIVEAPRTVSVSAGSAEVDVPTTAVVVRLLLVSTPAGWRVASYERAG
ncbi:MAG: hypothetical protein ACRDS0_04465 [Pseudonocardiaceae bacterium]